MLLHPEVLFISYGLNESSGTAYDTPPENRPGRRSRIVGVPVRQSGIGAPHDALQFPELGKEARSFVVDFRRVGGYC